MLKIDLSSLRNKIDAMVNEYYSLKKKPVVKDIDKESMWIKDMITPYVENSIINLELKGIEQINVSERVNIEDYNHTSVRKNCIKTKGYKIEKSLGEYSDKFLLQDGRVAKVKLLSLWQYKQKDEMKSTIKNEFNICKKVEKLNIGPKVFDSFICSNNKDTHAFKVIVTEYIKGMSLREWIDSNPRMSERKRVADIITQKMNLMHENGIIHNYLHENNIIVKIYNKKVEDIYFTDFTDAYDVQDKKMWDYNKWIQNDRRVIDRVKNNVRSYSNADDIVNYVAYTLLSQNEIIIK